MIYDDLQYGERLSQQAGWNQTAADWRRFLELEPSGCFVAELRGQLVGTVTTCVFDHVGWIGMVLVAPTARRKGVGRALMRQAIESLESQGADTIRLDATPMGEPLYRSLGFTAQYQLTRFAGIVDSPCDEKNIERPQKRDWEHIAAFDELLTGYSRQKLLNQFAAEPNVYAFVVKKKCEILGYACTRPGRFAAHVGPCMASNSEVGESLFRRAVSQHGSQPVFVDVPDGNRLAVEAIVSLGLEPARQLVRMCRGNVTLETIESLWASGGPAKG